MFEEVYYGTSEHRAKLLKKIWFQLMNCPQKYSP
uniref:Uncharacterized protein n=1 Tax=Anguilla anguilla TaxID=7936 RepID=A0A0E9V622_ANGAN